MKYFICNSCKTPFRCMFREDGDIIEMHKADGKWYRDKPCENKVYGKTSFTYISEEEVILELL